MSPIQNDENAEKAKNLTIALRLLDSYWDKLSSNLSEEDRDLLVKELEALEPKIRDSKNLAETSEEAVRLFNVFSKIEPLSFLTEINDTMKRGASLKSQEDEVRIKILNYCVMLKSKMQEELP